MEVEDDMVLLRQHGNNQEVMTRMPPGMEGTIEPGMRVSINAAFSIISTISKAADVRAQVMELINSPGIDYDMIGGLDEAIDVAKELAGIDLDQTVRLIYYPRSRSVFSQYFKRISLATEMFVNPIRRLELYLHELQMQPLMLMPFNLK
jgi:hypothetical protein